VQELVEKRLAEVAAQAAAAFGARAEVTYDKLYPPTINDPAEAARVVRLARGLFGAERVVADMEPSMGSEDFAFMLQAKPGAYFRLGTGAQPGAFLHSPHYDFNDAVIPVGAALFAAIAEDALGAAA
jgi:hippurate hydrolase